VSRTECSPYFSLTNNISTSTILRPSFHHVDKRGQLRPLSDTNFISSAGGVGVCLVLGVGVSGVEKKACIVRFGKQLFE